MHPNIRPSILPSGSPRPRTMPRIVSAIDDGDLPRACRLLEAELRRAPADPRLRRQLANLKEAIGDRDGAAAELTRLLRMTPADAAAAQHLAALLALGRLGPAAALDPAGLAACLSHRSIDRDLVGAAAVDWLARTGSLQKALEIARNSGPDVAASVILGRRSSPLFRDALLQAVLQHCAICSLELERLLTAIRRWLLLELPAGRLAEAELFRFTVALAAQCWNNEYVFAETAIETSRVEALGRSLAAAAIGAQEAENALLIYALYRDPLNVLPTDSASESVTKLTREPFAALLREMIFERQSVRDLASAIPRLGEIRNRTSLDVKAQYEAHPYPRWKGASLVPGGHYIGYLETFFSAAELAFCRAPFEVLIAGCGTGQQAVSAALDYGALARVTGLDISSASLGYAALMAGRMGAHNLALALGDINDVGTFEPAWRGRFHVIECSGVLHHMTDPFASWRDLLDCLAPGGLMLVGLYSAIARRDLEILRQEAIYPAAGCDDAALRGYRQKLLQRGPDAPGAGFLTSRDTATTSGFRDFFLHVSETATTLPEIQRFLDANGLRFRGFVNAPPGALQRRFPGASSPGCLEQWAAIEAERPDLFIGMYQFWVSF